MTNAKKNPAGVGEISTQSKTDTKGHGKIVPFSPKTGQRGIQRKKSVRRKKEEESKYIQQEIPFPWTDGEPGKTGEFARHVGKCPASGARRIGLGAGLATDRPDEKREEGIAAADQ
jgi:hypothetical protein